MDMLLEDETVEAYSMVGKSHDCGDKEGYTKTFVEYAMNHETLGASIIKQIEEQTNSKTSN
jgi:UTP--glucose-1-phosphate uridylyltransferase